MLLRIWEHHAGKNNNTATGAEVEVQHKSNAITTSWCITANGYHHSVAGGGCSSMTIVSLSLATRWSNNNNEQQHRCNNCKCAMRSTSSNSNNELLPKCVLKSTYRHYEYQSFNLIWGSWASVNLGKSSKQYMYVWLVSLSRKQSPKKNWPPDVATRNILLKVSKRFNREIEHIRNRWTHNHSLTHPYVCLHHCLKILTRWVSQAVSKALAPKLRSYKVPSWIFVLNRCFDDNCWTSGYLPILGWKHSQSRTSLTTHWCQQ
jgi:hypothetical protein